MRSQLQLAFGIGLHPAHDRHAPVAGLRRAHADDVTHFDFGRTTRLFGERYPTGAFVQHLPTRAIESLGTARGLPKRLHTVRHLQNDVSVELVVDCALHILLAQSVMQRSNAAANERLILRRGAIEHALRRDAPLLDQALEHFAIARLLRCLRQAQLGRRCIPLQILHLLVQHARQGKRIETDVSAGIGHAAMVRQSLGGLVAIQPHQEQAMGILGLTQRLQLRVLAKARNIGFYLSQLTLQ